MPGHNVVSLQATCTRQRKPGMGNLRSDCPAVCPCLVWALTNAWGGTLANSSMAGTPAMLHRGVLCSASASLHPCKADVKVMARRSGQDNDKHLRAVKMV